MIEPSAANHRRTGWPCRLAFRGRLLLISAAALGFFFGGVERGWYPGAMAAISLGIVLGLAAQVHDLRRSFGENRTLTSEQRWGWRFAVAWRLAIMCLIVAHFLVRLLVKCKVLALNPGGNPVAMFHLGGVHDAVLLVAIIVTIANSPRQAKRAERRRWSWAGELLFGIAACVLWAIILRDQLLVPVLVHITIAGIELAQPLQFSSEALAAYDTRRLVHFFDVTTVGFVSVIASCVLLRLFALGWWRGRLWRAGLGVLFAASLTTTIVLSARIVLVEAPDITPALAADIPMPQPHQIMAAAVLALLLISAAARRWSEPPPVACAAGPFTWRRDEGRYYHERHVLLLPLASVMLLSLVSAGITELEMWNGFKGCFGNWIILGYWVCGLIEYPISCLSLALCILVLQSLFSQKNKCPGAVPTDPPPLAPVLFLLIWSALLAIIVFGVPILAAWGFALGFNVI